MNRRQDRPPRKGLFLQNEILGRKLKHRINICFAGNPNSGKSALATRFKDIDEGPYPESFIINKENKYVIPINLQRRPNVKKRGEVVLNIFIEPTPEMCQWFPIWLHAPLISLIVFCFDVNDKDTFNDTRKRLSMYSTLLGENLSPFIVLGNKIDVRDHPGRVRSRNAVPAKFAKLKTKRWQATRYFECSAWENRGVNGLLDFILNLALSFQ